MDLKKNRTRKEQDDEGFGKMEKYADVTGSISDL